MSDTRKPRGFAAMTPERRAEVSRMGGKSVAPEARAYAKDPELAARAGRAGGKAGGTRSREKADAK
jgi:general stress protein YciG